MSDQQSSEARENPVKLNMNTFTLIRRRSP